ncbi:MAG TPA: Uma2 family endonuclease [Candidatus Acidoferrum sp.]|nr:Uma2 family endonuclease [Candidatus Acidoferrum sp.]
MSPLDLETMLPESLRPLKRAEYDRLVAMGMFDEERLELLHGRLVAMSPQGNEHVYSVRRLTMILTPALLGRAQVQILGPVAASDESEPEPDVAVLTLDDFLEDHAHTAYLIVEVADSSRKRDLNLKPQLYAEMGVPDYWVLDLAKRELVVHRDPGGDRYREIRTFGPGDSVALLQLPDVVVRVADVLPPER